MKDSFLVLPLHSALVRSSVQTSLKMPTSSSRLWPQSVDVIKIYGLCPKCYCKCHGCCCSVHRKTRKWSSCSCRSCDSHSSKPVNMFAGACLHMHVFLSFFFICIWSLISQCAMQSHKNIPKSKSLDIKPSFMECHCLKKKKKKFPAQTQKTPG